MRKGGVLLAGLVLALPGLWAASAAAQPGSGPRETVDESFTTARPGSPTGVNFSAVFHAAGDPKGDPPFLRRVVIYPPQGMHFDTSVPDQCSATDAQLQVMGPDACPPGSRLGSGTAEGVFFVPFAHQFVFDRYRHDVQVLNNADEQITLVHSEGFTVVRARLRPDGSIEMEPPSCFPAPPTGQCADDYVLAVKTATSLPVYTRTLGGSVRSYATTPPACPASGSWQTTVRLWWADGSSDSVVSKQPCARPAKHRRHRHRHRHRSGR